VTLARALAGAAALALIGFGVLRLEGFRAGLEIRRTAVGDTPASVYRQPGSRGPAVVVAHGFAGSRQLMEAWALTLARAGYQAVSFDFLGHGRHPVPMSGDVTRIEGTTRLLVEQTRAVIGFAETLPGAGDRPVGLLGHSMASDIIIRTAIADERSGPVVAISAFSKAVSATEPGSMLLVTGAWEPHLRAAALEYLRQVDPRAGEGERAVGPDGTRRRAVVAPHVEHVGVLYSQVGLVAALDWLDRHYGRASPATAVAATGGPIVALLLGCVLLAWPLAGLVPAGRASPPALPRRLWLRALALPALATPLLLSVLDTGFLPVLVADYLAVHLLCYGLIALAVLWHGGVRPRGLSLWPLLLLLAWGLGIFGVALDRYVASFMPHAGRLPVIAAIAAGAVPFMIVDALLTGAGRARWWRRLATRAAFLVSLGLAVALDFEGLFFLVIIAPVIVLFYLVFGTAAGWVGRRLGQPLVPGVALGLVLGWAIGVSFPMFSS